MTESLVGKTKQIEVSPRMIETASRLFNSTLSDIINELLQNSRRARATRVDINFAQINKDRWLMFEDDGIGFFHNGLAIALGASGWDKQTLNREDPAGLGLFSLANRGAAIESSNCRVELSPAHFCGKEKFAAEKSDRAIGTKIGFAITTKEVESVERVVKHCAQYYPLPVYFNGEQVEQRDFLEHSLYRRVWQGLEIGVERGDRVQEINFYGLTIVPNLPEVKWSGSERDTFGVKISVINAPNLKLVLPARKEVVVDEFFHTLVEECYRTIYLYFATLDTHQLAYKHWQHAAELDVTLPEAKSSLIPYQPRRADGDLLEFGFEQESIPTNGLILSAELSTAQAHTFWRGFTQFDRSYTLYESCTEYQGYSWYDRLPQLTEVSFSFEITGGRFSAVDWVKSLHGDRPDSIWINAKIVRANGDAEHLEFQTDLMLAEAVAYSFDLSDDVILVTKDSKIDVAELIEVLEAAFFDPSDDCDVNSVYTQREDFQEMVTEIATSILFSQAEAFRQRVRLIVERYIQWLVPHAHDCKVEITINGNQVSIKQKGLN